MGSQTFSVPGLRVSRSATARVRSCPKNLIRRALAPSGGVDARRRSRRAATLLWRSPVLLHKLAVVLGAGFGVQTRSCSLLLEPLQRRIARLPHRSRRLPSKCSFRRTPEPHTRLSECQYVIRSSRQMDTCASWRWRDYLGSSHLVRGSRTCVACRPRRGLKTQGSIMHAVFRVGRCRIRKRTKFGRSLHVKANGKRPDWLGAHEHSSYEVSHSLRLGGFKL